MIKTKIQKRTSGASTASSSDNMQVQTGGSVQRSTTNTATMPTNEFDVCFVENSNCCGLDTAEQTKLEQPFFPPHHLCGELSCSFINMYFGYEFHIVTICQQKVACR